MTSHTSMTRRRQIASVGLSAVLAGGLPMAVEAHHASHKLSVASPRCGWVEGDDLRDRRRAAEFCGRWVDRELGIAGASAVGERLWIEATPELRATLREDNRYTAALLTNWMKHWRETSGYTSAVVILVAQHVEFARIETTMTGDVVVLR